MATVLDELDRRLAYYEACGSFLSGLIGFFLAALFSDWTNWFIIIPFLIFVGSALLFVRHYIPVRKLILSDASVGCKLVEPA